MTTNKREREKKGEDNKLSSVMSVLFFREGEHKI